ncbi:hypothetical protein HDIA_3971 [Hartmannibacter diazotrophicus]|uniref:DUF429 domain-containing protein n=1 Tax=Hartmannibacter diazotrophicus TaxID=1482074 RepID=A0A2C9DB10_9HYPH|nr:DUF429 domain-containing protein [Hartmannibacter diazotrophicus]SON57512.1 hypothetical protein HDIA_3971 [Hartmannibacter diazotrophicus]
MTDEPPAARPSLVAGVDGCPGGWMVVTIRLEGDAPPIARVVPQFLDVFFGSEVPGIVAVDMPIGLPDRAGIGGRGAEVAVRPLLGERQSSVFSVPSRSAVACEDYREACRVALATSDPPRKVSKQAFHLFPKIREIDALLRADTGLQERVHEVHPEVAFWRLNGERAMSLPKKIKGSVNPAGLDERRQLLEASGFSSDFLSQKPPRGAAGDDFVDACACAAIASRIARGLARPFPQEDIYDAHGLRIAIWA